MVLGAGDAVVDGGVEGVLLRTRDFLDCYVMEEVEAEEGVGVFKIAHLERELVEAGVRGDLVACRGLKNCNSV